MSSHDDFCVRVCVDVAHRQGRSELVPGVTAENSIVLLIEGNINEAVRIVAVTEAVLAVVDRVVAGSGRPRTRILDA